MNGYLLTIIGLFIIFFMTSLGAAFVYFIKNKVSENFKRISFGFAGGVMFAASIFSLILPALEDESNSNWLDPKFNWVIVVASFILGCLFIYSFDKIIPHFHSGTNEEEGLKTTKIKRSTKMFLAVTLHNVPEGLSVGLAFGAAFATKDLSSPLFLTALTLAIGLGIQNLPEGLAVSLPLKDEGFSKNKAFLYGVFSGILEPIAALFGILLLNFIAPIMPFALAFSAGTMIYLVVEELLPEANLDSNNHFGTWSFIIGFVVMMILDVSLSSL